MITLRIKNIIWPVFEVKKLKQNFFSISGKLTTLVFLFVKNKVKRKGKLDSLFFKGENNSKAFENCLVIRPESPPLKSTINLLLLSIKSLLYGCLKSSFNVNELFNSSNILIIFSFKSLLFSLKYDPCGL